MMQVPAGCTDVLVWDSVGEWSRCGHVRPLRTLQEVHAAVVSNQSVRVGYVGPIAPPPDLDLERGLYFETFCRLAWVWLRMRRGRVLVIEELADVTAPGKAPAAWGEIVRKGRHHGCKIYACTQRPAESDKTIAGNADIIHAGRQSFPRDRKSMAEYLDVDAAEVTALQSLEYIERDMRTRAIRRGRLKI